MAGGIDQGQDFTLWGSQWGSPWGGELAAVDHLALMRSHLYVQFRGTNWDQVLEVFAESHQRIADQFARLRFELPIANASGAQLDRWAEALGLTRGGLSDDDLRAALLVRVPAITMPRTPELMIRIFRVLAATVGASATYRESYPATIEIDIAGASIEAAAFWIEQARRAKAYGVRLLLNVDPCPGESFTFDAPGLGFDQGKWATTLEA